jgi:ribonucleoside-diphosphate reductase beta chain
MAGDADPFQTTGPTGLRHDLLPMRLYHKAKRDGIWDPRDIDLRQDARDWQRLEEDHQEGLLRLTAMFQAGEEGVTRELLPLIMAVEADGYLEETIYLATFHWEEAKHTEFFRRFLDEVCVERGDLTRFHTPSYRRIFYEELPGAMDALRADSSLVTQARAAVTYNMIVEGVLAESGYHVYFTVTERMGILPGLREGLTKVRQDESRHIAYGLYLLSRLIAADPAVWPAVESHMTRLAEIALGMLTELLPQDDESDGRLIPVAPDEFASFTMNQIQRRYARLASARDQSEADVEQTASEDD